MKNTFKKLFFFVLASATVVSCDLGSEDEPNFGNGPFVAQFPYATSTGYFLKDEGVVYPYDVPVELVGGNGLAVSQDIVLSYEVDMENSTAVEGVNFDFVNDTNTATIPAGNAFSTIPIVIYSATLDDQDPPVLVLKLTEVTAEGVNVVASGSQGTIALTLQGTCSSDLAGMYNLVVTRTSSPGTYNLPGEAIIAHGTGQYLTDSTGPYNNRGLV
ncbi:MAG TPA: hypothetical protein VK623_04355, partial [Flavobacterium sp.]|nr:hypothetical protein [Flavobacterium sp.]